MRVYDQRPRGSGAMPISAEPRAPLRYEGRRNRPALVSQLAEETDSKPVQCEFESHRGHLVGRDLPPRRPKSEIIRRRCTAGAVFPARAVPEPTAATRLANGAPAPTVSCRGATVFLGKHRAERLRLQTWQLRDARPRRDGRMAQRNARTASRRRGSEPARGASTTPKASRGGNVSSTSPPGWP